MKIKTGKQTHFDWENIKDYDIIENEVSNKFYILGISFLLSKEDFKENTCEISLESLISRLNQLVQIMKDKDNTKEICAFKFMDYNFLFKSLNSLFSFYNKKSILCVDMKELEKENLIFSENLDNFKNKLDVFLNNNEINFMLNSSNEREFLSTFQRLDDCHFIRIESTKEILTKLSLDNRQEEFQIYEVYVKSTNDKHYLRTDFLNSKRYLFLNLEEDLTEWRIQDKRFPYGCHKIYCVINPKTFLSSYDICKLLK